MAAYNSFNVGDAVEVIRPCLLSTGKRGEVVWKRRGLIGVKVPGFGGTLSFNPSSLQRKVVIDFFKCDPVVPVKSPTTYKVGCAEIKQVLQQIFDTEEEAKTALYDWSLRLGGKTCQLLVVHSEYVAQLNPKLVKVG